MKKTKYIICLICICTVALLTGCSKQQTETIILPEQNQKETYGSRLRGSEPEIYHKFLEGDSTPICSYEESKEIQTIEVANAVNAAYLDYPSLKLLGYKIESDEEKGVYIYTDAQAYEAGKEKLQAADAEADRILETLELDNLDRTQKYRRIYEYIIDNVGYVPTEKVYDDGLNPEFEDESTIYGALVNKSANSEGIADAFKILTAKAGLEAMIVTGFVDNLVHAWIIIPDEQGDFLVIDPTMGKINKDEYFMVNDLELSGRYPEIIYNRIVTD